MTSNPNKVAIVILNWNGRKFLEKFLPSVIEHSQRVAQIIVADNDSKDDSIDFLKATYPQIRIIRNKQNGGFAKGYNDALFQVDAEYYILLNSDIEVTDNWIEPIIRAMDSDKSIGACQPKILSFTNKEMFEYAGAAGGFIDKYGYPFCRGRIFQSLEIDNKQYDDSMEVFWATGACMFVRADLYKSHGGFDEDFFAHMEEIDFCWRLKNSGYQIRYCSDSKVYHIGGGTLPKNNPKKTFLNFRNNFILLYKNLPSNRIITVFLIRIPFDCIAAIKFLFTGGFKDFFAVGHAYISFYFHLRKHLNKRKNIQQKQVTNMFNKSIVIKHYLHKVKQFSSLKTTDFTN